MKVIIELTEKDQNFSQIMAAVIGAGSVTVTEVPEATPEEKPAPVEAAPEVEEKPAKKKRKSTKKKEEEPAPVEEEEEATTEVEEAEEDAKVISAQDLKAMVAKWRSEDPEKFARLRTAKREVVGGDRKLSDLTDEEVAEILSKL